jgi:uncharacterized protein YuzE
VKITYDPSVDAAYIKIKSDDDTSSFGFTYCCDPLTVNGQINLDFDDSGRLVGIEIMEASKKLPSYLLRTIASKA